MSYKWLTYKHNIQARCYLFRTLEFKSFISIPIYISIDGSFSFTQDYFLSLRIVVLLLYYLYCLCKLFKDRFFLRCFSFQKADAKVRTLSDIFQMFSEVFFLFSFRLPYSWLELGQKERKTLGFLHRFCQNVNCKAYRLLESGCKSSAYIYSIQIYLSFFHKFFETNL